MKNRYRMTRRVPSATGCRLTRRSQLRNDVARNVTGLLRRFSLLVVVLSCVPVVSVHGQKTLSWRGCGVSKTAFMEACAVAYEKQTGITIQLSGGGAALGIEAAGTGGSDLGGTCRHCLASNKEDWPDLELVVVAWDALVPIVHPENPVNDISCEQLKQVFQQKITNWKTVGGPDKTIVVTARRGQLSGVGHCVRLLILGDASAKYGETVVHLNSSGPVEKLVQRQPDTIAITGVSSSKKRNVKILSVDGVPATVENIAAGTYPFYRPLYIAYRPGTNPEADKFIEWLRSDKGQHVIEEQGTVSARQAPKLAEKFFPNLRGLHDLSMIKGDTTVEAEVSR